MKFEYIEMKQSDGIGSGSFLKIGDGQSVNVVFRGEVAKFWQTWPMGGTKQIFNEPTAGASMRFRVNVVVHENGAFTAKVWEFSPTVSNTLHEISKDLDLSKSKCKITRMGSGKKTQWIVIPLGPVDKKAMQAIEAVELLPLSPQEPAGPRTETKEDEFGF